MQFVFTDYSYQLFIRSKLLFFPSVYISAILNMKMSALFLCASDCECFLSKSIVYTWMWIKRVFPDGNLIFFDFFFSKSFITQHKLELNHSGHPTSFLLQLFECQRRSLFNLFEKKTRMINFQNLQTRDHFPSSWYTLISTKPKMLVSEAFYYIRQSFHFTAFLERMQVYNDILR